MAEKYLLELLESAGENEFITRHLIKAKDRQMVKYHYHRTLKDWGYTDTSWDKHCLEGPHHVHAEIHGIKSLDDIEWEVLSDHIYEWSKV